MASLDSRACQTLLSSQSMCATGSLRDLPLNCWSHIAVFLDDASAAAFRLTCKAAFNSVDLYQLHMQHEDVAGLLILADEDTNRYRHIARIDFFLSVYRLLYEEQFNAQLTSFTHSLQSLHTMVLHLCVHSCHLPKLLDKPVVHWEPLQQFLSSLPSHLSLTVKCSIENSRRSRSLCHHMAGMAMSSFSLDWLQACQAAGGQLHLYSPPEGFRINQMQTMQDWSCLRTLNGIVVDMTTNLDWLSAASNLTHLEVACMYHTNEMLETSPTEQVAERVLGQQLAALVHLHTLVLVDFAGDLQALLQDLSSLPFLANLAIRGSVHLATTTNPGHIALLADFPSLTSLSVDRMHLPEPCVQLPGLMKLEDQLVSLYWGIQVGHRCSSTDKCFLWQIYVLAFMEQKAKLDLAMYGAQVGLNSTGMMRLPQVLPSVQQCSVRWMWEGFMLKAAGWQHLTKLSLAHVNSGGDWLLLRTLQALTELRVLHCQSHSTLQDILAPLPDLPYLATLALSGVVLPELNKHRNGVSSSLAGGAAASPSAAAASTIPGAVWGMGMPQVVDLYASDKQLYSANLTSGCPLIGPSSLNVSVGGLDTVVDSERLMPPAIWLLSGSLSRIRTLRRLELSDFCAWCLEMVIHAAKEGQLENLEQLRLTQSAFLQARQVSALCADLPGLVKLELGGVGQRHDDSFRDSDQIRGLNMDRSGYLHVAWDLEEDMFATCIKPQ